MRSGSAPGLLIIFVPMSMVSVGHKMSDEIQPEYVKDIAPLLAVLRQPDAARYRHLMLGFGDQFTRIDFQVDSPNADGNYHTARTDPVLRSSGIGTLDLRSTTKVASRRCARCCRGLIS